MKIKTNSPELAAVCEKLSVDAEIAERVNDTEPDYIIMSGDGIKSMVELANSPKGKMALNMLKSFL